MKVIGLKRLTGETIDGMAAKLLTYYKPGFFLHLRNTDLKAIATFLEQKHEICFDFGSVIGFADDGTKIIGAFNPAKKLILIDQSLSADANKFNFTLAHELGHLALHRKLKFVYEYPQEIIGKDSIEFTKDNYNDADWMEWQANRYAAGLLMPRQMMAEKLAQAKLRLNLSRPDHLYVNEHSQSVSDYFLIIEDLSSFFGVSYTAIKIRLASLGMVTDYRNKPAPPVNLDILPDIIDDLPDAPF